MTANSSHSRLYSSLLILPLRDGRVYFFNSWIWAFCMTFFHQRNFKKSDASRGLKTACALGLPFSHCLEPFCHRWQNPGQPLPRWKHMGQKTRGPEEAPTLSVLPTTRHVSEVVSVFSHWVAFSLPVLSNKETDFVWQRQGVLVPFPNFWPTEHVSIIKLLF